ncbi:hypothetical protein [Winogradskyella sp. UBA3174]|uniref:hypothetical protein n=1 Tax=Winogradskyella sp. UBA3174 TaxID=1947785 RepID=UPI0025FFF7AE|nr:hypothetical protein [Winogradskyella sp. UBA3174]|tara:strand:+ start:65393 stop:65938 length:546 start_codon:yes stop_codon:yes gene_type:complete
MKKIILMIIICLVSCKEEKSLKLEELDKFEKEEVIVKDEDVFKVVLSIKIKENDRLDLFYTGEFPDDEFNEYERLGKDVKGSNEFQIIEFNLPEGVLPYKFRIDLGKNSNRHQTQVDIEWINLEFNDNKINIKNLVLKSFFHPNIYLEQNDDGYLRKTVADKFDPFIVSKPVLNKKIELEL